MTDINKLIDLGFKIEFMKKEYNDSLKELSINDIDKYEINIVNNIDSSVKEYYLEGVVNIKENIIDLINE